MKILRAVALGRRLAAWRRQKKKTVFTNGCFDILHRGHVEYLKKAKKLGDLLIVGVNSDASVRRLKGASRPVNQLEDRMYMLAQYPFIDFLVPFSEDTPDRLIRKIQPDVLVKGADYKPEQVVGRQFAGRLVLIPLIHGRSTSKTLARLACEK